MQRQEIEKYINENYDCMEEHPWNDTPNFATFKHSDNKKWFALIMDIPYDRLKINKDGYVDVINLKNIPEFIGGLRQINGIFPAYHMNKEHWISVILDGTLDVKKIKELIDLSYEITRTKTKRKETKKKNG